MFDDIAAPDMSRVKIATTHTVLRTSPKGQAFIGACIQCGKEDLTLSQARGECDNPLAMTEEESILEVLV